MIISASRRTDIPAFFADWFMERVREGHCDVANPFNPRQVRRVSFAPADADAIVFWTRNAAPMLPYLDELDGLGYRCYFLYTLLDYPEALEPGLPPLETRVDTFKRLADTIGPDRVIWRYDPIVLSNLTPFDYHVEAFPRLLDLLREHTRRVVVSLMDPYKSVMRRLRAAGVEVINSPETRPEFPEMMRVIASSAIDADMEIVSCAEDVDLRRYGIQPGKCIDDELIYRLFGVRVTSRKDKGQRAACGCVESVDIGSYGTCGHKCLYCYASL